MKKVLLLVLSLLLSLSLGLTAACAWNAGDDPVDSSSQSSSSSDSTSDSSTGHEPLEIYVDSVEPNQNFVAFKANTAEKGNDVLSKRSEFTDRAVPYTVGDDNPFSVRPEILFVDGDNEYVTPHEPWSFHISVLVKEGDSYRDLGEGLDFDALIENIDDIACSVDFTDAAVGKSFLISVIPYGLTERQLEDSASYTQNIEVSVVDGYNVYSAKELSYLNNGGEHKADWETFRTANGLTAPAPNALILQTNITITANDIIPQLFWTADEVGADNASIVGSFKDYEEVYYRQVLTGERFDLIGNYFTLNALQIPLVKADQNGSAYADGTTYESHSQLIRFENSTDDSREGSASMQNLNMIGNAPRVEDTQKSGGLILVKSQEVAFLARNNISNGWFINYFPNYTDRTFLMESCKAYDAFSMLVYVWGSSDVQINNCEFIGAGGPAILADHTSPDSADGGRPSKVVVTNSEIHSYVTGGEAWFSMHSATQTSALIKSLDYAFNAFGRSFVKGSSNGGSETYLDFQAFYKSGNAEGLTQEVIKGFLSINGAAMPMDFGTYSTVDPNYVNPYSAYVNQFIQTATPMGAPTVVTNVGGMGFIAMDANVNNGLPFVATMGANGIEPIMNPDDNIFKGDQLYLYYNYMGICLGYNNVNDVYAPVK